jgi:hypothetical protein
MASNTERAKCYKTHLQVYTLEHKVYFVLKQKGLVFDGISLHSVNSEKGLVLISRHKFHVFHR